MSSTKELWLPTTTTRAQVNHHDVKVWDDITFEKRKLKTPIAPKPPAPQEATA